jgi:hypothetical protein
MNHHETKKAKLGIPRLASKIWLECNAYTVATFFLRRRATKPMPSAPMPQMTIEAGSGTADKVPSNVGLLESAPLPQ